MKNLAFIILIVLNFNSCNAKKNTTKMQDTVIPQITKDSEKFDINTFKKEKDSISGKHIIFNKEFYLEEEKQSTGFISRKYPNNSHFMISKKYYENGNIKQKSVSFINGYPINSIFNFNKKGKFVGGTNTDEGYSYSWKSILLYCDKNNITLEKGFSKSGGVATEIYKTELDDKKVWQITYFDKKAEKIFQVILDGQDGELLNKKEMELVGS